MGDLVNLRAVKKHRDREAAAAVAEANRRRHGRTKAEKSAEATANRLAAKILDQARLDPPDGSSG